jgi:hypothetical protein
MPPHPPLMLRHHNAHSHTHTHTHTGLAHNFAGSSYPKGIASVMDYPSPIVTLSAEGALQSVQLS